MKPWHPAILCMLSCPLFYSTQSIFTIQPGQVIDFRESQRQFHAYRQQNDLSKVKGWKHWKRYEHDMVLHSNGHGEPDGFATYVREAINVADIKQQQSSNPVWSPAGPSSWPVNNVGYAENGIGRVNFVTFHPTQANTFYVGVAQGGLWKTTNNGLSYTVLTDQLPITRVSDLCIDPTDHDKMYLSVCDFEYIDKGLYLDGRKRHTHYGLGVYKTIDGGQTWNPTGLTFQLTEGDASLIRKIVINPAAPDELVACGVSGMHRSTDGGATWTRTLDTLFWDMEQDPNHPAVLYAASGYLVNRNLGHAAVYKSVDFGQSWTMLNTGIPPQQQVQRIKLALSPTNSNYVYALCCDIVSGFYGLYKSTDAGATWSVTTKYPNILEHGNGSNAGGQGAYDLAICVNDTNPEIIYTGGVNLWGSADGGSTMFPVSHWTYNNGVNTVHADVHHIQQNPHTRAYFVSTDGGVYRSHKIDPGTWGVNWTTQWENLNSGMQVTSFYRLSSSRNAQDRLVAGAQDNMTFYREGNIWTSIFGGDGMDNYLDPYNNDRVLGSSQFGKFYISDNDGATYIHLNTQTANEPSEWVTPVVADYKHPGVMYIGHTNIVKSLTHGFTWSPLASITSESVSGQSTEITALAVSEVNSAVLWAARRVRHELMLPGIVFTSTDGGTTFKHVTANLPDSLYFTGIEASPQHSAEAVVCMAGFVAGEKVYETKNGGASWTNISYNLPNIPVNSIKYVPGTTQLIAATDLGIYILNPDTIAWQAYSAGLPNVICSDIEINEAVNKVYISTFGRGIWETSLSGIIALDPDDESAALKKSMSSPIARLYPSINRGDFMIETFTSEKTFSISVIDVLGREVHASSHIRQKEFFQLELLPGTYYVRVTDGKMVSVLKMVVEE